MEAKDTVMSEEEAYTAIRPYWVKSTLCKECGTVREGFHCLSSPERDNEIAKSQAEISFKAGYKEGKNQQLSDAYGAGIEEGKRQLRKEHE